MPRKQQLDHERLENLGKELEARSSVHLRIQYLLEQGVKFHESIWRDEEEFWKEVKKNPKKFHARFASFSLFFGKFAPPRIDPPRDPENKTRMTPDKLQELELSPDQIRKLADLDGEAKQPEVMPKEE